MVAVLKGRNSLHPPMLALSLLLKCFKVNFWVIVVLLWFVNGFCSFVTALSLVSTQLPVRQTREELVEEVKSMFLQKYSKYTVCCVHAWGISVRLFTLHHAYSDNATGKEYRQVPYSREDMHVDGLPSGVSFCNPRLYNRHQLEDIMKAEHGITFVMSNPGKLSNVQLHVCTCIVDNVVHVEYSTVLDKLMSKVLLISYSVCHAVLCNDQVIVSARTLCATTLALGYFVHKSV